MTTDDFQDTYTVTLTRTIKDGDTTFVADLGPGVVATEPARTIPGALMALAVAVEEWAMEAFMSDLDAGNFDHLAK